MGPKTSKPFQVRPCLSILPITSFGSLKDENISQTNISKTFLRAQRDTIAIKVDLCARV